MDAPVYPPATAFVAPVIAPEPLNARTTPMAVLLAEPEAKAILLKEIPYLEMALGAEALRPHLTNFSPLSLSQFGLLNAEALARLDAAFAKLVASRSMTR